MAELLRIVRGHHVSDRQGNRYGILDFNPDLGDPAIALAIDPRGSGGEGSQPVVRLGRVLEVGAISWRAVEVHTTEPVYLVLEAEPATATESIEASPGTD